MSLQCCEARSPRNKPHRSQTGPLLRLLQLLRLLLLLRPLPALRGRVGEQQQQYDARTHGSNAIIFFYYQLAAAIVPRGHAKLVSRASQKLGQLTSTQMITGDGVCVLLIYRPSKMNE